MAAERSRPDAIAIGNGTALGSRGVLEAWACEHGVKLDFIRPNMPAENWFIESFNGKLRDKCLNTELFFSLSAACQKLALWRKDYNEQRTPQRAGRPGSGAVLPTCC